MYGVTMPCSHQYFLGATKPSVPENFNVSFLDTWQTYVLDIVNLERETPDETLEHIEYAKDLTRRNIKRFSGSKKIRASKICR
jgi:hypothetical protein